MNDRRVLFPFLLILTAAGCSSPQLVKDNQPAAMQAALDRMRFDMGCQNPTGTFLSKEGVLPQVGSGGWATGRSTQYLIRVTGCEKTAEFTVNCTDAGICNATMNRANPGASPTTL